MTASEIDPAASGRRAGAGMGAYAASKSGVMRFTEALAEELKGRGITVNALVIDSPGGGFRGPGGRPLDEHYERDVIDDELADPRLFRHPAQLYRRGLREGLTEIGGGMWLSRQLDVPLFELECVDSR